MPDNYQILIQKLDEFIRKYYRNQLLKGLILFGGILVFTYLLITAFEYFGHFGPVVRTIMFYLFIIANIAVVLVFVTDPLLRLKKIGKIISYEQASEIIGTHFPEIRDKLLNTLQLKKLSDFPTENIDLLRAGIEQKINLLRPIPFVSAIDLSKNKRFLKYLLPPLFMLLMITLISPSLITRPTERIIRHNKEFAVDMPYHILILNKTLEAFQQEDFTLHVKVTGEKVPDEVYLQSEGTTFKLEKENNVLFSFTFKAVQRTKEFSLIAGKFHSEAYILKVYPKPTILNYDVDLNYPSYLVRKNETLENTGDIIVPEGTVITWKIYTKDVDEIMFRLDTVTRVLTRKDGNKFEFSTTTMKSQRYIIRPDNSYSRKNDSLAYQITVIPDAHPSIMAAEVKDTAAKSRLFFEGIIKDDYGFSRLTFNYTVTNHGDLATKQSYTENLSLNRYLNQQPFYYSVDLSRIIKNPGDEMDYYFEVCDNDGIHGPKCARSGMFNFKAPSLKEIEQLTAKQEQTITKTLENSIVEAKKLQQQIDELNKKLVEKSTLNWQDKKQIEDLIERQKELKENLDNLQQENEKKNNYEEQYKNIDPTIMDKQKQLNQLFNEVMDDETKKMIDELKNMLDKIDKNKISDMLEKMKFSNKDLEKQLDRSLELFKQIEFEKNLSEAIDRLNKLAEKQDKLSDETEKKESSNEKLSSDQKEINDEFDKMKQDLDDLNKKNSELEEPNKMPDTKKEEEEIKNDLNKSSESLNKKENKSANQSQKKASKGMKSLSQKLESAAEEMESEEAGEDMERLRQILQDLVSISFDQEDLMRKTQIVQRTDPKYLAIIQDQKDLKDDMSSVEDSLFQLAKRQIMIKPYIMREVSSVNQNIEDAVSNLNTRNIQLATAKQQYVMTSVNNLALLLSEALKQMESNMQSSCSKSGKSSSCKSGKSGGKMSMKSMRQMQENLNKELKKLKEQMDSQKEGMQKYGKSGNRQMSEQLARMAAEQEAIRNQMGKYMEQLNEEGVKDQNSLNGAMKQMEQTEKDLVNRKILQETLNRQNEILTRLLDSEKAELKRGQEEKRQSTEAKEGNFSNPKSNFQYNIQKTTSTELLKTVQPSYRYFYKNKINEYFLKFEK